MGKKKVLIFSLDYLPGEIGGAERALKEITDRIDPKDVEFHLLTLRYDTTMAREEQIGTVRVHRIGFGRAHPTIAQRRSFPLHLNKHLFQFTAAWKAHQLHKQYQYDGVWAMMAHSCGVPAALCKWWHPEVRLILTLQEGDPPEYIERKARLVWPLFRRAFTTADCIQTISTFLAAWAKRMGAQQNPIVIPNAVATAHFAQEYSAAEIAATERELGKKSGDVFLVTTSRLVHKNGIDTVIAALAKLPPRVHFVVFGNGPLHAELEAHAAAVGVTDRVQFRGLIDHADMPRYLNACNIFIRPSRSEGMGNSFVEAMAARLPVIATQEGGIADFLFDAKRNPEKETTGWAVDANSPEQIAAAVTDIITHPKQVNTVTETAYQLAVTTYDWDLIARDMREKVFGPTLGI